MVIGAIVMILSGYVLGSQITEALLNPSQIPSYAPIFIFGGIAVNAASFPAFIKGFKALSL